jgi:hypothetical protein
LSQPQRLIPYNSLHIHISLRCAVHQKLYLFVHIKYKFIFVNIVIIFQYSLFQHTNQIPLHILVDFAVAGEGTAAFFVAAEGTDEVRVFDLFVEVADKAGVADKSVLYS